MTHDTTVYAKASAVRISAILMAILVGFTVVGLPVSVWLVIVALGRVELNADAIRLKPGGTMRWAEVARFGIGFKSSQPEGGSGPSQRTTTVHLLLQDVSGRRLAVHTTNYVRSRALLEEIKQRVGRAPERLRVSFPFQRLSFPES
jgi:hypothetical protein